MPHPYQDTIHELDPTINPAGVHAYMMLQFSTLDHLSREVFREEILIAHASETVEPGFLKLTATSYGMEEDFHHWEPKLEKPQPREPKPDSSQWEGQRITNRLQLWTSEQHPGQWEICGKENYVSALASPQDLLTLAHLILQQFDPLPSGQPPAQRTQS